MPLAFHVAPEYQLVLFRPIGRLTESDFITLCRAAYTHPDRSPDFVHFWDTRAIDELVMNVSVIPMYRNFLAEHEHQITTGRVAVVSGRSMTRTFAFMLANAAKRMQATIRLFDDVETAADWVDLPPDALTNVPDAQWTKP